MKISKISIWVVFFTVIAIYFTSCQSDLNSTNVLEQEDVNIATSDPEPTSEPTKESSPEPSETPVPTDTPSPTDIPVVDIKNLKFRGNPSYLWQASSGFVHSATFSPDAAVLAYVASDIIKVLDMRSFNTVADLEGHTDQISGLVWTPDGNALISASIDGSVIFWETESYTQSVVLQTGSVYSLDISPDGSELVIGQESGNIQLWDVALNELIDSIDSDTGLAVRSLSWSPDGSLIACGDEAGSLLVVDSNSLEIIRTLSQDGSTASSINSLEWSSPDGKILASGNQNGQVHLWDTVKWEIINIIELNEGSIDEISWVPNSSGLTICGESSGVTLRDIDSGEKNASLDKSDPITACVWSRNGKYLALTEIYEAEDGTIDSFVWIYIRSN